MQIEVRAFRKQTRFSDEAKKHSYEVNTSVGSCIVEGVDPDGFPQASAYVALVSYAIAGGRLSGIDQCTPDRLEFSCRAWSELHGTWLRLPDGWEKGGGNG